MAEKKINNLSVGSKGSDVQKLQKSLINKGYNVGGTGADGIYGTNTAAAVKQYQKDNGLAVDGIAGKNTLGQLYSGGNAITKAVGDPNAKAVATNAVGDPNAKPVASKLMNKITNPVSPAAGSNAQKSQNITIGDFTTPGFNAGASETVNQANALLQQHMGTKPGAFDSSWDDTANEYWNQYQNRDPFSYDFNTDALYNQYKDNYIQQGQMAMMDTMGQAAALTGGYGNSYAQTVGQQVYNQHLNQLNDVIPQLQQMAYDRYNQEGQDLLNSYNMAMDRYNLDYGQYQDSLSNWWREADYLNTNYQTEADRAYDMWNTTTGMAWDDYQTGQQMDYQKHRDAVADEQWNQQWAAEQESINLDNQLKKIQIGQLTAKSSGGGGGGGGGKPKPTYDELTWEEKQQLIDIFGGAETTEDLAALANIFGAGYNPEDIDSILAYAGGDLYGQGTGLDTTVDPLTVEDPMEQVRRSRAEKHEDRFTH